MSYVTPGHAEKNHQRFLDAVRSRTTLWLLTKDGGFANSVHEGEIVVPVWSDHMAATACANAIFEGYAIEPVSFEDFLVILESLADRGYWVGTNMTPDLLGIDVPAGKLLELINAQPAVPPDRR